MNLFLGDPILSGQLVSLFFGSLLIVTVFLLLKLTKAMNSAATTAGGEAGTTTEPLLSGADA